MGGFTLHDALYRAEPVRFPPIYYWFWSLFSWLALTIPYGFYASNVQNFEISMVLWSAVYWIISPLYSLLTTYSFTSFLVSNGQFEGLNVGLLVWRFGLVFPGLFVLIAGIVSSFRSRIVLRPAAFNSVIILASCSSRVLSGFLTKGGAL